MRIEIFRPTDLTDAIAVVQALRLGCAVVLSLEGCVEPGRILDFVNGAGVMLRCKSDRITPTVFVFQPRRDDANDDLEIAGIGANSLAAGRAGLVGCRFLG